MYHYYDSRMIPRLFRTPYDGGIVWGISAECGEKSNFLITSYCVEKHVEGPSDMI
jgi:hypothetical protein